MLEIVAICNVTEVANNRAITHADTIVIVLVKGNAKAHVRVHACVLVVIHARIVVPGVNPINIEHANQQSLFT